MELNSKIRSAIAADIRKIGEDIQNRFNLVACIVENPVNDGEEGDFNLFKSSKQRSVAFDSFKKCEDHLRKIREILEAWGKISRI